MMTMMTMILTTWMDRDRIQHPEGLMTVTMQIQAIPVRWRRLAPLLAVF
jgi:hypothetical protein